jgi:hypothetical protein
MTLITMLDGMVEQRCKDKSMNMVRLSEFLCRDAKFILSIVGLSLFPRLCSNPNSKNVK